jgi:hypothetical protein
VSDLMQRIIERGAGRTPRVSPVLPSRFENPPLHDLATLDDPAPVEGVDPERPMRYSNDAVPQSSGNREDPLSPEEREIAPLKEWVLRAPPLPPAHVIKTPARPTADAADVPAPPDPPVDDAPAEFFTPAPVERSAPDRERIAPPAHAPAAATVTVNLTIGHIELKSAPSAPPKPARRPAPPRVSLDDYLKRRNGGAR